MTKDEKKLLSVPDLKNRGWTEAAIKNFAGLHDDTCPNPHYKSGSPMRFWLTRRILRIEKTKRFLAWKENAGARKTAAESGVRTRVTNMETAVSNAEITIERGWSEDRLRELSLRTHGGNYKGKPGEWRWNARTARNTIRHNLTNYEQLWRKINRGDTGCEAYDILRGRVEALIDEAYPEYVEESDGL